MRIAKLVPAAAIVFVGLVACGASEESIEDSSAAAKAAKECKTKKRAAAPVCPQNASPVCGCDGVTYGNDCKANAYVSSFTPGACPQAPAAECKIKSPKPGICAEIHDPVCGCDGKTYSNDCVAAAYVTSFTDGACAPQCKTKKPAVAPACPQNVDPVCGCNGVTYNNDCEANAYVSSFSPGPCAAPPPAECKIKSPKQTACLEIYEPVCGCDGKTYGNDCEAAAYVTSFTDGACPK